MHTFLVKSINPLSKDYGRAIYITQDSPNMSKAGDKALSYGFDYDTISRVRQ